MILRPRRLAAALAAGELSEGDKFRYLLLWALIGLLLESHVSGWNGWSRLRVAYVVLSLLITAIGLISCFQANARGDNRAFLERYLCLSAPLSLVTYAAYYGLYYGIGAMGFATGVVKTDASNWNAGAVSLVSSMSALVVYFVWMRASLMRAAGLRAA